MNILYHQVWMGLAGGLIGFAHCLGMCGGFVLQLSQGAPGTRASFRALSWFVGKLFSYLFLGALAGFAGGFAAKELAQLAVVQNLLSYLAGSLILGAGLSLLGLLPVGRRSSPGNRGPLLPGANLATSVLAKLFVAPGPGAALVLGLGTGFLPCPIVVAFLAYALQSGSVTTGMVTMGALGIGTGLPLLLVGGLTLFPGIRRRSWAPRAGGVILVLLGLITALRGTPAFHHLLGCPEAPSLGQTASSAEKPCCQGGTHGTVGGN